MGTVGYTAKEWEFIRDHIEQQLNEGRQKRGIDFNGVSSLAVLLSLKRRNLPLGKKVWSRPSIISIAEQMGFASRLVDGSKYGHIDWSAARSPS